MTRYHVSIPYWWVKLFEAGCCPNDPIRDLQHREGFQDRLPGLPPGISLLPSLGIDELCTFANILNHILASEQDLTAQDLTTRFIQVEANLGEKLRQSSRRSQSRTALELPLLLSQLKLLNFEPKTGRVHPFDLFGKMTWAQNQGLGLVEYAPLEQTWELIFGYIDPFADAMRRRQGQDSLSHVIKKAPLMAWYSAWLDLSGYDLLVYLRMQEAVQWHVNCLNLNGVFYASLSSLLEGIPEQGLRRRVQGGTTLDKCYILLRRILKQLGDHGAVKVLNELDAYPFDPVAGQWNGVGVAWQVADLNALEQDAHSFLERPAQLFSKRFLPNMTEFFAASIPAAETSDLSMLRKDLQELWPRLDEADRSAFLNQYPDPRLFSILAIFAEWSMRARLQGERGLPAAIRDSIISPLLDTKNGLNLGERYSRFSKILRSQSFYAEYLTQDSESSFCHQGRDHADEGAEKNSYDHRLFRAPDLAPAATNLLGTIFETTIGSVDEPIPAPAKIQVLSKASQMRLEKTAADELDRLARSNVGRYQELVKQFTSSLDAEAEAIMAELKLHLSKSDFDHHIRKRLIQYIISRPQEWTAGRSSNLSAVRF